MKKLLSILAILAFMSVQSQTIHNPATIGQSNRNQATGRGLWVKSDTALFTSKIWVPQSAGIGKVLRSDASGFASWDSITAILVTKAQFLTLDSLGMLSPNTLYKITDIENGLFVNTLSENTFSLSGDLSLLIPSYTISGNNLGQMKWDDIPTIQPNEFVTWGGFYWKNNTASPITPTITDNITLDGGLTKLSKSIANGYVDYPLSVEINTSLDIIFLSDEFGNSFRISEFDIFGSNIQLYYYENNQWGYSDKWQNNECAILNCYGDGVIALNKNDSGCGYIKNANVKSGGFIIQNNFTVAGGSQKAYIENVTLNSGTIGSFIYGNELHLSYISNVELTDWSIDENHLTNLSFIKNVTANGNGSFGYIASCVFNRNCGLDGLTFTTDKQINNVYLDNQSVISNVTDINMVNFACDMSLDLTGFATDIISQTINSGKGWFTITHDFATSNLNSGDTLLYNIIPIGAKVTSIKAFGDATGGAGATLAFGINTDAPNLIPSAVLATVNAGQIYSLLSASSTANRSLAITAGVNNVTGGSVTVYVEFITE